MSFQSVQMQTEFSSEAEFTFEAYFRSGQKGSVVGEEEQVLRSTEFGTNSACLPEQANKTYCREGQEAEPELPKAPGHVGWLPASVQHMLFSVSMSGLTECRAVLRQSLLFCGFYT